MRLPNEGEIRVLAETIVHALEDVPPLCNHGRASAVCFECRVGLVSTMIMGAVYAVGHMVPAPPGPG